ncbi:MAG: UDP-N-acetylmuramate dehydrogenase [Bacteroidales bacterium]|nr:UDP-N-acetylmuramate dehydrogenase [Bacteroidales bacterium]
MHIQKNVSLKKYNTFGVDITCKQFICIDKEEELPYLFEDKIFDTRFFILGGGSNVLFTQDFDGNILHLRTQGIEVCQENVHEVYLKVASGVLWDDFVEFCIERAYYGVENLIGIPGLVGSSPVQNIGAYGAELKDVMHAVEGVWIRNRKPFVFNNVDCKFSYRDSIFKNELKNQCLLTHVVFKLSKEKHFNLSYRALQEELPVKESVLTLRHITQAVMQLRKKKLPDVRKLGSAGSFFKNPLVTQVHFQRLIQTYPDLVHFPTETGPVKLAAGQLIELAGWKAKRINNVGVYPHQALVIVNYENARGREIYEFSKEIQKDVFQKFKIQLEPEVNIMF